ncbi:sigma 54-interacting transcriptional regulator [Desulforamulus aeronauticus]|uniref:PAS domain S-box-containing protein n=1 Tax=Desulforamulus aeronauticus DSM 10349 TaxID=1121421 RepID=A0A1M6S0L1_9FIRM|nr:sigma 54-interacting transcriptional regulator [Desulforamulus aeronauticus]SHK38127.1 PAS domain S-box-containing protein [Desulforamulus aeronauticus DSM 10349]
MSSEVNSAYGNLIQEGINSLSIGILLLDAKGYVSFANTSFQEIVNKTDQELIGKHIQHFSFGISLLNELSPININGVPFNLNCTKVMKNSSLLATLVELHNISKLQQLQDELNRKQNLVNLLQAIFDSDRECIVGVDANEKIIMINNAYCNLLDVKREELLGKNVQEAIENTRLHVVLRTGQSEVGEIQRIKGNDTICSRILLKENGQVQGAVGKVMFKDVSELRSLMKRVDLLKSELAFYKEELKRYQGTSYLLDDIIGTSEAMQNLKNLVVRVARNDSTVLIRGESGTGKELFAQALHNASQRAHNPFIKVNCAALPENLLESELFGYQEGAFTGARKGGKIGKFELANKGTIFLDEIGDMPLNMQVKLLRVLQEKEIERLGENRPIKVNIRVVAATNRNLEEMIGEGQFREDLFYRLNVVTLEVPPLRERPEDIPELVKLLMEKLAWQLGCSPKTLTPSALNTLLSYSWPGNVRELENLLERILNMIDDDTITVNQISPYIHKDKVSKAAVEIRPMKEAIESLERNLILNTLDSTAGDCLAAARLLQISKSTLYEKINRYKITKKFN